jgi:hypothetical protein
LAAKKRRAADIGVDEFLDGAFKELGGGSDDDGSDDEAAAASDDSDSDEVRTHRMLRRLARPYNALCIALAPRIGPFFMLGAAPWLRVRNPDGCWLRRTGRSLPLRPRTAAPTATTCRTTSRPARRVRAGGKRWQQGG